MLRPLTKSEAFALATCLAVVFLCFVLIASNNSREFGGSIPNQNTAAIAAAPKQHEVSGNWLTKDAAGFFTALLFGVAGIQAIFFFIQLRLMNKGVNDAAIAATAAADAAGAATRQARVAEDSFKSVERPHVLIFGAGGIAVDHTSPVGDLSVCTGYSVGNYGRMPAIIKYASAGMSVGARPDLPTMVSRNHSLIATPVMRLDEVRSDLTECLQGSDAFNYDNFGRLIVETGPDADLFLWVIIQYRGPFTDHHETSACWRFDHVSRRFIGPHGGEEYNWYK